MDDAQILALRRKCESHEDGESVISLDKETALAMLRKLAACKVEQARVNTVNAELTGRLANLERENAEVPRERSELNLLRRYLCEEHQRPMFADVTGAVGPATYASVLMNRQREAVAAAEERVEKLESLLRISVETNGHLLADRSRA